MQQILHLLVVDRDRRAALAATYGSRWLLPVATCAERARAAPLVHRWAAERGIQGDVAGQWLGRVTSDGIDWLIVVTARAGYADPQPPLQWTLLETLCAGRSVLDYQQWAIATTLERDALPSVRGPFGRLSWPGVVRTWIAEAAGGAVLSLTPYRVGAHEIVLGADCARGRVYFKGLTEERATEARLTQALAAVAPDSFAQTLALETRTDGSVWWLTAACGGRPAGKLHRAAEVLARVQQRAMTADHASLPLRNLEMHAAASWASVLLADSPCGEVVRQHCADASRADVPTTWIPMDLDPANILVDDGHRVRFIDVDDSFFGPAPLAIAILARRSGDRTLYQTYERSWSPPLKRLDWPAFEVAAKVAESWLGWKRLARNIGRGEVHAERDLLASRVRARLAMAIGGISLSRVRRDDPEA